MSTNTIVTDGELGQLARKQNELFTRVKKGTLPVAQVLAALQSVIEGSPPVIPIRKPKRVKTHIINLLAAPSIPSEFAGVDQHKRGPIDFIWDPTKVRFYLSPNQEGGQQSHGGSLHQEIISQSPFNANLLDYLLNHTYLIPDQWKKDAAGETYYIYFWGTIYYDSDDNLYVRSLARVGGGWISGYRGLNSMFDSRRLAACLAE
jgi:hypothetical protein